MPARTKDRAATDRLAGTVARADAATGGEAAAGGARAATGGEATAGGARAARSGQAAKDGARAATSGEATAGGARAAKGGEAAAEGSAGAVKGAGAPADGGAGAVAGGVEAAVASEGLAVDTSHLPRGASRARLAMAAASDYEAFRHALRRGQVTFHDVACAWFHISDPELSEPQREPFKQIFPHLLDAFAEPRGGIVTSYFCRHIRIAAALTDIDSAARRSEGVPTSTPRSLLDDDSLAPAEPAGNGHGHEPDEGSRPRRWLTRESAPDAENAAPRGQTALNPFRANPASSSAIHLEPTFGDPADWHAKALLFRCLHLHYKALEFLTPQPRKICMRLVFGVITALLGTLDSHRARLDDGAADEPLELETLEHEIAEAERYYEAAMQRQAQLEYLVGMLMALATAGAVVAVLAVTGVNPLGHPLGVSLIAGGIGGVLSVMTRMTSGSLHLRAEAGEWAIRALGGIRPIVGAAFGAAIYVLLAGGIVSVFQPPTSGDKTLFYAGLAFLAGFSERFAQDAIAGATAAVSPPTTTTKAAVTGR